MVVMLTSASVRLPTPSETYQLVKSGKSALVWLVFRDILTYLTLVSSSGLASVLLYILIPSRHAVFQDILASYAQMMGCVVTSHILLHLREYISEGVGSRTLANVSITTIQFQAEPEFSLAERPRRRLGKAQE